MNWRMSAIRNRDDGMVVVIVVANGWWDNW
jgi:hypothetical protein